MNHLARNWKSVAAETLTDVRAGGASVALDARAVEVDRVAEALAEAYRQGADANLAAELAKGVRGRLDLVAREVGRALRMVADFELYSLAASESPTQSIPIAAVARDGAALVSALATDDAAATYASLREARDRVVLLERELERSRGAHEQTKEELRKTALLLQEEANSRWVSAEAYEALADQYNKVVPIVRAATAYAIAVVECTGIGEAHEALLCAVKKVAT